MFKPNKEQLVGVFFHWLPIGGVVLLMGGLLCVGFQYSSRMSFNDQQVQIAEDISVGLSEGRSLGQFSQQIDISKSLATYIIIYDDKGAALTASGLLNGETPVPPMGVFDFTRENGENRITWEPQEGVRSAIVVRNFSGSAGSGFILVGRNMREFEARKTDLSMKIAYGILLTLVVSFGLDLVSDKWRRRAKKAVPIVEGSPSDLKTS